MVEYELVEVPRERSAQLRRALNGLADQGWRLVQILEGRCLTLVMERPRLRYQATHPHPSSITATASTSTTPSGATSSSTTGPSAPSK